jgi:SAM-dependent methyltransferase
MIKKRVNPWDLIASKYDEQFGDEGDYSHKYIIYPSLMQELDSIGVENKKILDMGCGTGTLARKLFKKGGNITGIDYSSEMITYAKARNYIGSDKYKIVDIRKNLPYQNASFNIILQVMLLHSIEDEYVQSIAKETNRILDRNGICIIVIPHPFFVKDFRSVRHPEKDLYLSHYKSSSNWKQFDEACNSPTLFNLRPLQFYANKFIDSGFSITRMLEPKIIDTEEAFKAKPHNFARREEIPGFMLIKFVKSNYDKK